MDSIEKAEELEFFEKQATAKAGTFIEVPNHMIAALGSMHKIPGAGRKDDKDKARMDLIPAEAMFALADILGYGAKKYGEYNWTKGMDWSRIYAAAQRHMNAWWMGEEYDEETKKTHLAHAMCCLAFLISYEINKLGNDDRPTYAK